MLSRATHRPASFDPSRILARAATPFRRGGRPAPHAEMICGAPWAGGTRAHAGENRTGSGCTRRRTQLLPPPQCLWGRASGVGSDSPSNDLRSLHSLLFSPRPRRCRVCPSPAETPARSAHVVGTTKAASTEKHGVGDTMGRNMADAVNLRRPSLAPQRQILLRCA